jgi:hypothetical protein
MNEWIESKQASVARIRASVGRLVGGCAVKRRNRGTEEQRNRGTEGLELVALLYACVE